MIVERTRAGPDAAKAQGRTGGRPTVMDADKLAAAKARKAKGESVTTIAKALHASRATLYWALADTESHAPARAPCRGGPADVAGPRPTLGEK
ncbi:helix-turn-helix domain-containing protein [Streptomyces sp. NPDC007971]|uniref:helix-turn-helix domain-containing protein n=1 Tax=Streptomyces sp. NPDC007971 TaxID=3364799 RepID=UPI0036E546BA